MIGVVSDWQGRDASRTEANPIRSRGRLRSGRDTTSQGSQHISRADGCRAVGGAMPEAYASTGPRPRGRGWTSTQYPMPKLKPGFNGAAPARARMALICNSFWRRGAILCLRPPARIRLLLCSCRLIVHSLLGYYQVVTSCASASGFFRITSPLAG